VHKLKFQEFYLIKDFVAGILFLRNDKMLLTRGPGGPSCPAAPGRPCSPYRKEKDYFSMNKRTGILER
jgi:hypothetical protein